MACVPIMGGLTVFSVYFYHTEEWTERNQQILEATSREIRRCRWPWILSGDFNMEPETFWALRRNRETARSVGQASSTHFQAWSVSPML